jgi:hypothetical protein
MSNFTALVRSKCSNRQTVDFETACEIVWKIKTANALKLRAEIDYKI